MARKDGGASAHSLDSTDARGGGARVVIRREGSAVLIRLTMAQDYHAIELYERLVQSAQNGTLRMELKINQN